MLSDLKGKPLWAKGWALVTVVAAVVMLTSFFTGEGMSRSGRFAMIFVCSSSALWYGLSHSGEFEGGARHIP